MIISIINEKKKKMNKVHIGYKPNEILHYYPRRLDVDESILIHY